MKIVALILLFAVAVVVCGWALITTAEVLTEKAGLTGPEIIALVIVLSLFFGGSSGGRK